MIANHAVLVISERFRLHTEHHGEKFIVADEGIVRQFPIIVKKQLVNRYVHHKYLLNSTQTTTVCVCVCVCVCLSVRVRYDSSFV